MPPRSPRMFDGSSSSSRKRFHFFQIILPATIQQKRLGLPKKFIRKFGKELSEVPVLTVPNGKKWQVELKEIEGEICLENGWQEFVDYYSIGVGHFLVFGYDGSSCFHVLIYDMSATEIEYPCHIMDFEEPNQENECRQAPPSKENKSVESLDASPPGLIRAESVKGVSNETVRHQTSTMGHLKPNGKCDAPSMEGSDSVKILDVSPKGQKRTDLMKAVIDESEPQQTSKVRRQTPKRVRNSTKNPEACFTGTRSTRSGKSKQEEVGMSGGRAIHAARQFKSENPFYVANVRLSYVNGPWMHLHYRFMETYAKKIKYITLVVSNNGSEKAWRCYLLWYNRTRSVMIYDGWKVFVAETNLKEGDVCIFELLNAEHNVFNVSIFRD